MNNFVCFARRFFLLDIPGALASLADPLKRPPIRSYPNSRTGVNDSVASPLGGPTHDRAMTPDAVAAVKKHFTGRFFDGGYFALTVRRIDGDGFAGTWSSGTAREAAAGYFCAERAAP